MGQGRIAESAHGGVLLMLFSEGVRAKRLDIE